jgi:hypothetical protein
MRKSRILTSTQTLSAEFVRCCEEYTSLHLAVAWAGNPQSLNFSKHLKRFGNRPTATVGIAFCQTHPDAIAWFMKSPATFRVFRDELGLFHPKVYFFERKNGYAVIIGSSNLTQSGFTQNAEINTLTEGTWRNGKGDDLRELRATLADWQTPACSFVPDEEWLDEYRERHRTVRAKLKREKLPSPAETEEATATGIWIGNDPWAAFYARVQLGLQRTNRTAEEYHMVLDAAAEILPIPWRVDYFEQIENRRIMGGMGKYGFLGHVAASFGLRGLMANKRPHEHYLIAEVMNRAASFKPPVPWQELEKQLNRLESHSTMKVWGRFLALVRPDLYCTVSAPSLQKNLSATLEVSPRDLTYTRGYIELLKRIHSSPWFQSKPPKEPEERAIWERRVAFIDPIFY